MGNPAKRPRRTANSEFTGAASQKATMLQYNTVSRDDATEMMMTVTLKMGNY